MSEPVLMIEGVRILLGTFASGPFAAGLVDLLSTTGDIGPIRFVDPADLVEVIGDEQPTIVILEGNDPLAYRFLLERAPHVAMVMLDTGRAETFVQLRNPSWNRLYQVIRAVAEELNNGSPAELRIGVVDVDPQAGREPLARADEGELGPITAWLDLGFARPLFALSLNQDAAGIPGWSIAPREALALLGLGREAVGDLTGEELTASYRALDRELIGNRAGLAPAVDQVASRLALTDDDLRLLLLITAPEIDGRYGTAIGVLQDDLTRRRPGLTLLSTLLEQPAPAVEIRRSLDRPGSLLRAGLVEPVAGSTGASGVEVGYAPTRGLVDYLLTGSGRLPNGSAGRRLIPAAGSDQPLSASEAAVAAHFDDILAVVAPAPLIHVPDPDADTWFPRIASGAGHATLQVDLGLIDRDRPATASLADWCTLGFLHDAGLFLTGLDAVPEADRYRVQQALGTERGRLRYLAVAGDLAAERIGQTPIVRLEKPRSGPIEQAAAWVSQAAAVGVALDIGDANRLAAMGVTTEADRRTCLALYRSTAHDPAQPPLAGLQRALRDLRRRSLPPVIRRLEPTYTWDDLVLPDQAMDVLRIIPDHMVHAGQVLELWHFDQRLPYGQGVAALFSGPSGTGKTMAAQVIAGALGVDLFQVDLSKVVSKYIGETEKNLDQVFDLAERDGAVLLFDEADALFGKRTEVRDSHDRHANVEVAYLLQRLEAFSGLAVLTTNLKQNIDGAFLRRLRFVVEFPMPSAAEREAIWRRSFPPATPLAPDIDLAFLARRLPITGGSIQQIALHAAFAAAAAGRRVGMGDVVEASRRELLKIGLLSAGKALDDAAA